MRFTPLLVLSLLLAPVAHAQGQVRDTLSPPPRPDSLRAAMPQPVRTDSVAAALRLRVALPRDTVSRVAPPALTPFGRLAQRRLDAALVARRQAAALAAQRQALLSTSWRRTTLRGLEPAAPAVVTADPAVQALAARAAADSARRAARANAPDLFGDYADLGLNLTARLESKVERQKNLSCTASQMLIPGLNCNGTFQPQFDFQFNVKTGGVVADRVHVNVDYDSQREFDASNNISVYYEGKTDELLQRLEVGNVSFQPTPSRFITSGIPSGNYGVQAIGQLGPMRFRTIVAQQKGNVVKDRVYTVGDRTLQTLDRDVEDYQVEPRRFFFTIDPRLLPGYPNIDVLDTRRLAQLAATLPDSLRPTKIYLYRQTIAGPQPNPNGPQFRLRGSRTDSRQLFEYLREGVDYYVDPSNLWIALVRPINLQNERLAVAYTVGAGQRTSAGGSPDTQYDQAEQVANLLWEPALSASDSSGVFWREIRSVYRLGGEDINRATVALRLTLGSGDQEKPTGGTAATFLQLFGLAQPNNPSVFDVDNRLWPRPSDPNYNRDAGGTGTKLIKDYFVVFPSLQPFARAGLAVSPNPANDTIYQTPGEYLYSSQRPPTLYHLRTRYQAEGGGETGTLALGSVQVRPNSERITVGGIPLVRGTDYTVDYELGRLTFTRPDTLFAQPRQVAVQYEENPLFASAPTSIFGMAAEFPMTNGQVNFTAISQSQKTTFNRPPLGFEPASSLVAGVTGQFQWDASLLTRALEKLPFVETTGMSSISVSGELATSRPQPNSAGQAYVESFEGEGGISVPLQDNAWYYASTPPATTALDRAAGVGTIDTTRATTLSWQNNGYLLWPDGSHKSSTFTFSQIDPQLRVAGGTYESPEQLLWLSLYPLSVGGVMREKNLALRPQWRVGDAPSGRRWRSLRVGLGASGMDLSRVETLEFWVLVNTQAERASRNPVLAIDLGDVSENSVAFSPETLSVSRSGTDSVWTGKKLAGWDTLDTERDPLSRSFSVTQNDNGLAGDVVRHLVVVDSSKGGAATVQDSATICQGGDRVLLAIGDSRANCTVHNNRLDEEDLDQDFALTTPENFYRYVIDLSDPKTWTRIGNEYDEPSTDSLGGQALVERKHWVLVRVPFRVPSDSFGTPNARRVKALRLTMVSGRGLADSVFSRIAIARLKLVGSPWLKRSDAVVRGIAGEEPGSGTVVAGMVGTQDRDSTGGGIFYVSPPGVTDQAESKQTGYESGQVQINERSLRLTAAPAAAVQPYDRAEAYYRFPEGQKNFMGYEQLRVWAKGRNHGWGAHGPLQFYVKIGRDASNFYLYRTDVQSGPDINAWKPEVVVDFRRFFDLRAKLQNAYLQGGRRNSCTGVDSALIAHSRFPLGTADTTVYAACQDGYMVLTTDPAVAPPNLAAVQELAVGMVRIDSAAGADPIVPSDTLELWVDDVRLTGVVNTPGYAGQVGLDVAAGDIATVHMNVSRRDPNFRQLGEQPTFLQDDALDLSTTVRLDRLLPQSLGLSMPFSVSHHGSGSDPTFLQNTDLQGAGIEGLRTPRGSATAFSLGLRRATPMRGALAPLLNNVELNGSYATGSTRSAYAQAENRSFGVNADYRLAAQDRSVRFPGWLDRVFGALPGFLEDAGPVRALRRSTMRWTPTQFTISSAVAHSNDRSLAFLKPAATGTDTARVSENLSYLWRNGSALEFRPWSALAMRWNIASVRDLRRYQDSVLSALRSGATATGISPALVAANEREKLLGLDIGLERERQMSTGLSFAPVLATWLRPRAEFSTQYSFIRNPADRTVLRTDDSTGAFRLPRRFNNSQNLNVGLTIEPTTAFASWFGEKRVRLQRLGRALTPLDLSWNRSLLSSFDGVAFTPGLGYQFGLGGLGSFLGTGGRSASNAGTTRTLSASTRIMLPLGTSLGTRFQRSFTQSWARRLNGSLGRVDGLTEGWPDLTLSWNWRPGSRLVQRLLESVGSNVGYQRTYQLSVTPSEQAGLGDERGESRGTRYPVTVSLAWAPLGGITTTGNWARTLRDDARPGSANNSRTSDMGFDIAKSFPLPASWKAQSDLRTRLSYQGQHTESYVLSSGSGNAGGTTRRSRLTDNGRRAVNLNADTDFADNLSGSLTLSQVLTFDNNFDRRFSQTVISAVLNLRFFAGELH